MILKAKGFLTLLFRLAATVRSYLFMTPIGKTFHLFDSEEDGVITRLSL